MKLHKGITLISKEQEMLERRMVKVETVVVEIKWKRETSQARSWRT